MVCQWWCLCAGQQGGIGQGDCQLLTCAFGAGGALQDAVGVCAHELGDPQLALFLARLLEGEQGTLQQALLTKELLPGCVLDHLNPFVLCKPCNEFIFSSATSCCKTKTLACKRCSYYDIINLNCAFQLVLKRISR